MTDMVNHPLHYTSHASGIECIQITEHMGFNLGNALKYIWRADLKSDAIEDLKKARFYLDRELALRDRGHSRREPRVVQSLTRELKDAAWRNVDGRLFYWSGYHVNYPWYREGVYGEWTDGWSGDASTGPFTEVIN